MDRTFRLTHRSLICAVIAMAFAFGTIVAMATEKIPVGMDLVLRNNAAISSGAARIGTRWTGSLVRPVVVNGETLAPAGATVNGRVADVQAAGGMNRPGELALEVTAVNGIPVASDIYAVDSEGHTRANASKVGGGAAAGALLGSIFGGGRGAAIGAAAGGGAGTASAANSSGHEAIIHPESTLRFRVQ